MYRNGGANYNKNSNNNGIKGNTKMSSLCPASSSPSPNSLAFPGSAAHTATTNLSTNKNGIAVPARPPRPPAPPVPARRRTVMLNVATATTGQQQQPINQSTAVNPQQQQSSTASSSNFLHHQKQPFPTSGTGVPTSPRMRRFAERLAVIQISLDPPSPPEFALQSPEEEGEHSTTDGANRLPVPFWAAQPGYEHYFRPIEDSLLLQVPRLLDQDEAGPLRQCSPPPRRCSYASTISENSSISLNTSYQSLLFSPMICPDQQQGMASARSRSSTYCSENEADTPPTNEAEFAWHQAQATQQQQQHQQFHHRRCQPHQNHRVVRRHGKLLEVGGAEEEEEEEEEDDNLQQQQHRSKRSHSQCYYNHQNNNASNNPHQRQQRHDDDDGQRQQRQRRSHSTVTIMSTPCEPIAQSPTVLLSPVLLSRPIRSQSAHSPNFIRSASAATSHPSDSESELLTAVCSSRAGSSGLPLSRQSYHRLSNNNTTTNGGSRPSNHSSPLATPPPMLGTINSGGSQAVSRSGSFSRHLLQQQQHNSFGSGGSVGSGSGSCYGGGNTRTRASGTFGGGGGIAIVGRCHSFTTRGGAQQPPLHNLHHFNGGNSPVAGQGQPLLPCHSSPHQQPHHHYSHHPLQRQRAGTFSQHDSFESSTSAGEGFPPSSTSPFYCSQATIARRISGQQHQQQQHPQQQQLQLQRPHSPHSLVAGSCVVVAPRPPSAAAQLQRSQSDAMDPTFSRHSSVGSSGRFPAAADRLLCIGSGYGSGGTARYGNAAAATTFRTANTAMAQQQQQRRAFTTSMRDLLQNDLLHLHSSLDSGSYRVEQQHHSSGIHTNHQYLCASSTASGTPTGGTQQQLQFALLSAAAAAANGQQQRSNISANLMRLRYCPLGHSDPQIYTYTQTPFYAPPGAVGLLIGSGRYSNASGGRRSFLSASPQTGKLQDSFLISPSSNSGGAAKHLQHHISGNGSPHGSAHGGDGISGVRKSPVQMRMHRSSFSSIGSGGGGHHHHHGHHTGGLHLNGGGVGISSASSSARPSISAGCPAAGGPGGGGGIIRQPIALRALPPGHHLENRRWSLASLPSSSGYGTPGTNSAYSSQYSSQENLAGLIGDLRIRDRFDSNESYSCCLGDDFGGFMRPRSRSLTSPVIPHLFDRLGLDTPLMSSVYKERFPKAKQQMETRLLQFLAQNAPLSGFTSQMLQLNIVPPSPMPGQQPPMPQPPRPSSPRPQSPVPMRPLSPLVTESATAIGDSVIHHRSSAQQFLSAGGSGGNTTGGGQQQQQLSATQPAVFFGAGTMPQQQQEAADQQQQLQSSLTSRSSICCSPLVGVPAAVLSNSDTQLLRLLSDGATRFLHHQLCEIAADCLQKSRDDLLSCAYFCNMSVRLDETLAEAEIKVGPESFKFLTRVVKQILMMVSRTARLLECLEFNPDEFYQLLGDAEVAVREQLGAGSARVPDLPQYILTKLGLNKNLSLEQTIGAMDEEEEEQHIHDEQRRTNRIIGEEDLERTPLPQGIPTKQTARKRSPPALGHPPIDTLRRVIAPEAPKEEDFETVRLVSNGAYGAVYLVKHKRTRQRFALKKMRKQTLILRNQIEQVFAERDILTFTDNPFVVCFYGSFETKHHLCMLMEYVEGGDCASLLKSAGTLPIELARLYVAETVLAIEYLHSCGIVHRDLKPDNLLITSMGHIKLTDFGLSKIGLMNRTTLVSEGYMLQDDTKQFQDNQLCGTPEYIAPEVILRQGYGKPVDWWALGVILYEFLVGIVPFLGDSPEALFANIINEEVEYPEGDEALDPDAESLIRMLLEKNPVDRLGTMGGAPQVSAHSFFAPIDFGTILRQKAEFVPQLENDEDTSYFDSRSERYNHDAESEAAEEDEQPPMFWSFSTASPRHSIVGLELPNGSMAMLQAAHAAAIERGQLLDVDDADNNNSATRAITPTASTSSGIGSAPNSAFATAPSSISARIATTGNCSDSQDSQPYEHHRINSKLGGAGVDFPGDVIPSAVILRRRFSNQRYANLSTSSSGTTGTGAGCQTNTNTTNTCSSTDSSLDATHFDVQQPRRSHGQLPRFAISPCAAAGISSTNTTATIGDNQTAQAQHPQLQRGNGILDRRLSTTTTDETYQTASRNATAADQQQQLYLSPVEEQQQQLRRQSQSTTTNGAIRRMQQKRPSAVVHELITDANRIGQQQQQKSTTLSSTTSSNSGTLLSRHSRSGSCRTTSITSATGKSASQRPDPSVASISTSLRVQIPGASGTGICHSLSPQQQHSAPATTQTTTAAISNTTYYHSYAGGTTATAQQILSGSSGPHSPAPSCNSMSSVSSLDSQKHPHQQQTHAGEPTTSSNTLEVHSSVANQGRPSALTSPSSLLPPPATHQLHRSSISGGQSRPIVIRKGAQGFGFTIRSVRVYLSEISEYYSIEHIVAAVREGSPAWEAGLRPNDLITHVHTQSVHNMTHPQLMHRLLSCGNELTVHVVPLASTSIKEGEPRRNVGKPLRKKPRKPTQPGAKAAAAKQTARAKNTSLFRRLSGKRGTGDIVPGTSSQKQTFMPRSVSSQEGVLAMPVTNAK